MTRVAVIGGGISGLAAARALHEAGIEAVVLEGSGRLGGALKTSEVAGVAVDEGADAFLVRVPHATRLAAALGVDLVNPAARQASLLIDGTLKPLPRSVLGVPLNLRNALPALQTAGAARAAADRYLKPTPYDGDTSVGEHLRRRLGSAVVDRLVEPLLGGVYAGQSDRLSLATVLPQFHDPAGGSLLRRAAAITPPQSDAPVFASLELGLGTFPARVADGLDVRLDTPVTGLTQTANGWVVETGPRSGPTATDYDAVVLAVPASRARKLLQHIDSQAVELAGSTDYASVAIVTIAWPRATSNTLRDATTSGWLVPPSTGHVVKAVTVGTSKWQHLRDAAPDLVIVRASVGRYGQERDLQREDRELVGVVAAEVAKVGDVRGKIVDSRVTRWGGALPQYAPGHLDRVRRLRDRLPASLRVAGAAYDGVGIPACIASGERAAAEIAQWVRGREREVSA